MKLVCHLIAAALFVVPAVGATQEAVNLGQKAKAWMVSNFRSGLECSGAQDGTLSFRGQASFDSSGNGGIEINSTPGDRGIPTVTAHAINTKGTGATGRTAGPRCPAATSASGTPTCTLTGEVLAPMVSVSIPLSVLGDAASRYVGTVTIVKRSGPSVSAIAASASRKGYDYYRAKGDLASSGAQTNPQLTYLATCDSSSLSAKGSRSSVATYDLAVAKK